MANIYQDLSQSILQCGCSGCSLVQTMPAELQVLHIVYSQYGAVHPNMQYMMLTIICNNSLEYICQCSITIHIYTIGIITLYEPPSVLLIYLDEMFYLWQGIHRSTTLFPLMAGVHILHY